MSLLPLICGLVVGLIALLFARFVRQIIQQWSLRKIPGPPNPSLFTGNFMQFFASQDALAFQDTLSDKYGRLFRLNGFFGDQLIFTSDPKAIHHILVKHPEVFDKANYIYEMFRLTLGKGLLAVPSGGTHKKQRKLMNPAFSIWHMKQMVPIFHTASKQLREILAADIKSNKHEEPDVLDYMSRYALELIAQAGFGSSFDALNGKENEFSSAFKRFAPIVVKLFKYRPLLPFLTSTFPPWFLRYAGELLPFRALHEIFKVVDILSLSSIRIWEEKKRMYDCGEKTSNSSLEEGRDILSILLHENSKASQDDRLPDEEVLGQINTFLAAGTDTTSNALARIIHQLSLNTGIQKKLREELVEANTLEHLSYEALDRLPYLDAVCRETMRLFPPVRFLRRVALQDHVLPLQTPAIDINGQSITEVFVPKGTGILCNAAAVNRDRAIWGADAHEWKPSRWLSPLPVSVAEAHISGVYANTLTFSGGSRSCIGFKFSELEMKVLLSQFLPVFRFDPPQKQEIVWRFGNISTPVTRAGFSKNKSELPLRVSCI